VVIPEGSPRRFDVYLVGLDPTIGSEMRKTRPCLVLSPDELNRHLRTVIVAPMTTGGRVYSWRVPVEFDGRSGQIAIDRLRTVARERLRRRLGVIDAQTGRRALEVLARVFAP
jgi:mRNA interferase MazF